MAGINLEGRAFLAEDDTPKPVASFADMMQETARRSAEEAALARQEAGITRSLTPTDKAVQAALMEETKPAVETVLPLENAIPEPSPVGVTELEPAPIAAVEGQLIETPQQPTQDTALPDAAIRQDQAVTQPSAEQTTVLPDQPAGLVAPTMGEQPSVDALSNQMLEPPVQEQQPITTEPTGPLSSLLDQKGLTKLPSASVESVEGFDAVKVQRALGVSADGVIGNQTRKALGQYQAERGLPATGFVDRQTLKAIEENKPAETTLDMEFTRNSLAGQALSSVEDLYYNPYSLNHQPILRGNRRHNSGLTIGAGFDLGQKNKQDLLNMGVSEELATKLEKSGWLNLRPSNAVTGDQDRFRTRGHNKMSDMYKQQAKDGTLLTLTPSEIDELTRAEYNKHQNDLKNLYENKGFGSWDDVSDEAKIALTVEKYHRGNLGNNPNAFLERAKNNDIRGITQLYLYEERAAPIRRVLRVD